jgi:tetratricopeptide (TPR) repeat protein
VASIDDLILEGNAALANGKEAEVLPRLEEAARQFPQDARVRQILSLLHRSLDQLDLAGLEIARAAALDPSGARIAHAQARIAMEAGLPSLDLYARAYGLAPNDGDLLISRSAAMLAEGQLSQAIAEFSALLTANPLWVQGHAALARLRQLAGDGDAATRSFDQALAAHPQSADLWLEKIRLLISAERFADAAEAVANAKQHLGELSALTLNEAICASEVGDHAHATALFAGFAPFDNVAIASRYMRQLLRTGRADEAAALGERLTDQPDADHVWPYLSVAWRLLGDPRWEWLEGDERLVGIYDISSELGDLDEIATILRALHTARAEPMDQSVRAGTQTDGPLFARIDPVIRRVRTAIVEAVSRHLDALPDDPTHPFLRYKQSPVRFAGSWSVRLTDGGFHANHVHPQGFLSSALYVVVPDLDEPPAGQLVLGQPPVELGLDLPPIRTIAPAPGKLALFPSIMWHGTAPFAAGERMSVAFDVAKPRT